MADYRSKSVGPESLVDSRVDLDLYDIRVTTIKRARYHSALALIISVISGGLGATIAAISLLADTKFAREWYANLSIYVIGLIGAMISYFAIHGKTGHVVDQIVDANEEVDSLSKADAKEETGHNARP